MIIHNIYKVNFNSHICELLYYNKAEYYIFSFICLIYFLEIRNFRGNFPPKTCLYLIQSNWRCFTDMDPCHLTQLKIVFC